MTDEELALALQRGDRSSLTPLVERYYDPLLGYLYRLMNGDRMLAQDLVQETFLRVLRAIRQYQHPRPFRPWLYAIATHIARSHYQRADTRRTLLLEDDFDPPDDADPPDAGVIARQDAQSVAAAVATLPEDQRETLILFYYQALSYQEIAAALEIPIGTVKSRLSISIRRLREQLMAGER